MEILCFILEFPFSKKYIQSLLIYLYTFLLHETFIVRNMRQVYTKIF